LFSVVEAKCIELLREIQKCQALGVEWHVASVMEGRCGRAVHQ